MRVALSRMRKVKKKEEEKRECNYRGVVWGGLGNSVVRVLKLGACASSGLWGGIFIQKGSREVVFLEECRTNGIDPNEMRWHGGCISIGPILSVRFSHLSIP
jgi:hypothetical protein